MLHGMLGRASNWQDIIDPLAANYRILALDLPYLELKKDDCNITFLTDYISGFMDSQGLDKAVYMGNSLGGHIALDMALRDPKRVEALILTGSSGLFERGFENGLQIHPTKGYLREKIGEIFFDKTHVTDGLIEEIHKVLLNRKYKINIVRLSKSAKSYNLKEHLHLIECPTLLIWGREDTITPPNVALEFKENIKNSRLKFIESCCHAPMMERPDAFLKLSQEFLLARP